MSLILKYLLNSFVFIWLLANGSNGLKLVSNTSPRDPPSQDKMNIAVYYETKCPDSRRFILYQIPDAMKSFSSLINIILVPFGKANYTWVKEKNEWYYQCQHGVQECYGNILHNCLIYYKPKYEDHFPFINCTMANIRDNIIDVANDCAQTLPFDMTTLIECANNSLGNQLHYGSGVITDHLIPPKNYVPWIVVDSLHTNEIQQNAEQNLTQFICNEYKGPKPTACPKIENDSLSIHSKFNLLQAYLLQISLFIILFYYRA